MGRGIAINRRGDGENARISYVEESALGIYNAGTIAQRAEGCVIECLGGVEVIGAHHNVTKHRCFLVLVFKNFFQQDSWR